MPIVISDSSPLVHLSAIGRFDFFKSIYTDLVIPPAVWEEVAIAGDGLPGSEDLRAAVGEGWIKIVTPTGSASALPKRPALDAGEAQALTLAIELGASMVLIDDLLGRQVATAIGLQPIGTLGVLVEAKRFGLITSFRSELRRLETGSDFIASSAVKQLALELAGEA